MGTLIQILSAVAPYLTTIEGLVEQYARTKQPPSPADVKTALDKAHADAVAELQALVDAHAAANAAADAALGQAAQLPITIAAQ